MPGIHLRLIVMILVFCLWLPALSAAMQQAEEAEYLPIIEKWRGDFDGMAERREIRALVGYSKTFYFLIKEDSGGLPANCSRSLKNSSIRRPTRKKESGLKCVYGAFSPNGRIRKIPDLDQYSFQFQSLATFEP